MSHSSNSTDDYPAESQPLLKPSADSDGNGNGNGIDAPAAAVSLPHLQDDAAEANCNEGGVNLLRWDHIAIPVCYLTVGLCQGLIRPLLNVYPLDLGANEAQQATVNLVVNIPATLKIIFGFLSDNCPLLGYRRKSYMLVGWLIVVFDMLNLLISSDVTMSYDDAGEAVPPTKAPSMELVSLSFLLFGLGMWWADVMADTIVAEKARLEPVACRGQLQATCYACRFFGIMVGAPISTLLYATHGPGSIIVFLACTPLTMIPLIYLLWEERSWSVDSTLARECAEIWNTVCSRAVWQPVGFIYLFNLLQVQNVAWRQFLRTVLDFGEADLNILLVVSYVCLFLGTLCYKYFFLQASWRSVYKLCIVVSAIVSGLQLLLIADNTFGIPDFWFALGDEATAEFISGMQFLPGAILFVALCPPGSEGASYAMFTTALNAGVLLAPSISSMLLPIWDVSEEALEDGNLGGLFNLGMLTTAIKLSPLLVLGWMPHSRTDLKQLCTARAGTSVIGGALFLTVIFVSIAYILIVGILNIVDPGWAGES